MLEGQSRFSRSVSRLALLLSALILAIPCPSASEAWSSLGPTNRAGRTLCVAFDPLNTDIIYAGTAGGGLWRSPDGGLTWTPLTDDLPRLAIGGVAVHPSDPNLIVIGTGEATNSLGEISGVGILRSTDGGSTWHPTDLVRDPADRHGFHVLRAGPNGTFLAGANDGLWRSGNGGLNWIAVKPGGDYYDVAWKPGDPNRVYTCKGNDSGGNNVKVSTDDGITWTKAGTGQPYSFLFGKSKLGVSGSTVYCLIGEPGVSGDVYDLIKSTDDGATWTEMNSAGIPSGQSWFNLACVADPDDAGTVIVGTTRLARSTNGGAVFSAVGSNVHAGNHDLVYHPGVDGNVMVATGGGVWDSTDDGHSWADRSAGLVTFQLYDVGLAQSVPDFLLGCSVSHGVNRWMGTSEWSDGLAASSATCHVAPGDASVTYAAGTLQIWKSTDGGRPWTWFPIMNGVTGLPAWMPPLAIDRRDGDHLYTATGDGIFRTTTGGNLWTNVSGLPATSISISPANGDIVWIAQGTSAFVTTDDGETWSPTAPLTFGSGAVTRILPHPAGASGALVTFSGSSPGAARIAFTMNWGAHWSDVTGDLPDQPVWAIAVDPIPPEEWYVGGESGVWRSSDAGTHWLPYGTGLPNARVTDLEIHDARRKLVAATFGRGAWEIDLGPPTEVEVSIDPASQGLRLDPPRPNPARDVVTFRFAARSEREVVLAVYDVRGRRVAEIARRSRGDGGFRQITWVAKDAPSGVYFAVLSAGGQLVSRKLVLAR
jgi:hypothetical protein